MKKLLLQFSDGVFVKEYKSIMKASRDTKINKNNIWCCCKNRRKTAGGFTWRYKYA